MANEKRLIDVRKWESFLQERQDFLDGKVYDPYYDGYEDAIGNVEDWMDAQPIVDAVEVVHGRWNMDEEMYAWNCSVCRSISLNGRRYSYCHNCGAKMDGDGNA